MSRQPVDEPHVIIRMQPMTREGSRYHGHVSMYEMELAFSSIGEDNFRMVLAAWNVFQLKHRLMGLTVFRRWVSIYHPRLIVWVYNR